MRRKTMKRKLYTCAAVMVVAYGVAQPAVAQSFLQRLGEQLNQQLNPPSTPAANADQPLPPPIESVPRNVPARAGLGIRLGPVTEAVVREQRLAVRRGAVITAIEQGSAADRAGLPIGAVIVALDGRRVDHPDDLVQAVQASRPGTDVELTYYDRNKLARKKVHLAAIAPAGLSEGPADANPPPVVQPAPIPAPPVPQPDSSGINLERDLGGSGSRPLLGRLGRVLDSVAAPIPGAAPSPPIVQPVDPIVPNPSNYQELQGVVTELRQQLSDLTREVESLRKQVAALESRVAEKK
jgi:hypothetical protein